MTPNSPFNGYNQTQGIPQGPEQPPPDATVTIVPIVEDGFDGFQVSVEENETIAVLVVTGPGAGSIAKQFVQNYTKDFSSVEASLIRA